jgi:capsular polysaccharide transport system permease protein
VRRARQAMTEFQTAHGDLDPQHKAEQLGQIVGSIESDLAVARAQLADAIPALNANSPIVVELKSKIASLEQQLQHQQTRLAGSGNASSYSLMLNQYQALQLEQDFAKNAYLQAQQGLVVARADAAGKRNYLVDFAPAMLPQRANLAVPLQYILSVFLGSLVFFGFFSILTGAFQDQIDF